MGYTIEIDTRSLRGQCHVDVDIENINKTYIEIIEEKYNINWKYSFIVDDEDEENKFFHVVWNGEGHDGYITDILGALFYVMKDKELDISGTLAFTECVGDLSHGLAFVTRQQVAVIYVADVCEEPIDKFDIQKIVADVKIIK